MKNLLKDTIALIERHTDPYNRHRLSRRELCERCEVQYGWFNTWLSGKIPNPGVVTIQRIHDVLKRRDAAMKRQGIKINSRKPFDEEAA